MAENETAYRTRQRKASDERDVILAVMANDIAYMKGQLSAIQAQVVSQYVNKDEFEPIRKIVYGLVGLILVSVVGGLMALVLQK